jgi:hypothetical protein
MMNSSRPVTDPKVLESLRQLPRTFPFSIDQECLGPRASALRRRGIASKAASSRWQKKP